MDSQLFINFTTVVTGTSVVRPPGAFTLTVTVFLSPGFELAGGVEETTPVLGSIVYFQPLSVVCVSTGLPSA